MTTLECPWCSSELELEMARTESSEETCPSCSSTWLTQSPANESLALAA